MKCKPLFLGKTEVGQRFDQNGVFVFFGNKYFTTSEQTRMFSNWQHRFKKQVHGIDIVDGWTDDTQTADAQFTTSSEISLGVYTADCLPVLIYVPNENKILAVHAGWRGIHKQILQKAVSQIQQPETALVWIGPHIQTKSFEVGLDVAKSIMGSALEGQRFVYDHKDPNKKYIDLSGLAKQQLHSLGVLDSNIWVSSVDTFSSTDHYSYRRDGSTGRLISFIALNS